MSKEDPVPNTPQKQGALLDLGAGAYVWMVCCVLGGVGCFLYGIKEADDPTFFTAFGLWGAAAVPVVFRLSYRAVEIIFSSPIVIAIFGLMIVVGAVLWLLRGMSPDLIHSLLGNEQFVRVLIIGFIITGLLGALGILSVAASKYSGKHFDHMVEKLHVSAELDQRDQEINLDLERERLSQQLQLKKMELDEQRLLIEQKKLEIEAAQARLLLASDKPAAPSPQPQSETPSTGEPSPNA